MVPLRAFFLTAAMLVSAWSAHGQALKQPELLARYHELIAEFDRPGFEAFARDYLAASAPDGDPCLFGCSSGFSGNGPDVSGEGYREFLVRADLVTLARALEFSSIALGHLEESTGQLQAYWESYMAAKNQAEMTSSQASDFLDRAWLDYAGCSGRVIPPILAAAALRSEVEQLKYRGSLSAEERQRLDSIDQVLRKITAENE